MNFNAVLIVSSSRSPLTFCPFPSALFSLFSLLLKCALMHVLPGRLEESRIPLAVSQISLHVALECAVGPLDSTQFGAVLPTQSECLSICTSLTWRKSAIRQAGFLNGLQLYWNGMVTEKVPGVVMPPAPPLWIVCARRPDAVPQLWGS